MWILIPILMLMIAGYFFGTAYLKARMKVYSLPRKEMFWCNKHGPFRKEHCLTLNSIVGFDPINAMTGKPGNIECCPICFKEKWDVAKGEAYN